MVRTATLKGCLFVAVWGVGSAVSVGAAQDYPHGINPHFDVAVIKENHSVDAIIRITGIKTGDTFAATNVPLKTLIALAYNVKDFQVVGAPGWTTSTRYDIIAKPDAPIEDRSDVLKMVQALLSDRFHLSMHQEVRQVSGFSLEVAKGGPKFKTSYEKHCGGAINAPTPAAGPSIPPSICGSVTGAGYHMRGMSISTDQLCSALANILNQPVVDASNMKGYFDFDLQWVPDSVALTAADPTTSNTNNEPGVSIFTALREQLA